MEIPASLRTWFMVDFLVNAAIAIPLLLVPEELLPRIGWTAVDPVSPRLVAAALMALGVQSWRLRGAGAETYRLMLSLKVIWSTTAIAGLTIAIGRGAPSATFGLLSAFLGFCGVWSHYAIRLRQQAQAEAQGASSGTDDSDGPSDNLESSAP